MDRREALALSLAGSHALRMAHQPQQDLPLFQPFAVAQDFLTEEQIERLIGENAPSLTDGKLGLGDSNVTVRRSKVAFLPAEDKHRWIYQRLWRAAQEVNRQMFCVDLADMEPNIQLARYDSADQGFYGWHTDFAAVRPLRKLSISIQLSRSEDYDGGDLELMFGAEPYRLDRTKGACLVFPSFMLHRVTPVTRGTRWSLVAWILGNRWR